MKYRLAQIKTRIDVATDSLPNIAAKKLHMDRGEILSWEIRRKSIDSRKKPDIYYVYTLEFETNRRLDTKKNNNLSIIDEEAEAKAARTPEYGPEIMGKRPVVVGSGPAGLFSALELAKAGFRPIIIERGPKMTERVEAVERFRREGVLDPEANMLFGEGGAFCQLNRGKDDHKGQDGNAHAHGPFVDMAGNEDERQPEQCKQDRRDSRQGGYV